MPDTEERWFIGSSVRMEVNDRAYELAAMHSAERPEFICECADLRCPALVRLSVTAFEQRRAAGRPIIAEGHLGA
jgi:hypothetical protein